MSDICKVYRFYGVKRDFSKFAVRSISGGSANYPPCHRKFWKIPPGVKSIFGIASSKIRIP